MAVPHTETRAPWLDGLNPAQHDAATATEGALLLLAGAGTGKTRALTARVAHLLATRQAWPGEILCVTFTNRAAREMRERVTATVGAVAEGMPWLGTFHATAARMLRRHASLVGLSADFTILDTDDAERLAKQVIADSGLDERRWPARGLTQLLDRWKNRGWTPALVPEAEGAGFADGRAVALYAAYQQQLAGFDAADFGDLLVHMLTLFRTDEAVRRQWQQRFAHALVDEFQDTNAAQYDWLKWLSQPARGGTGRIACVGDDDQSIYSWRGAEVANMLSFERDYPGARVVRLEQNYRSTGHILGAAGGVIGRNRTRLGKTLWSEADQGDKVEVIGVWDGPEEARLVAERLERLADEGVALDRAAILVRAQFQTREFEERFLSIGLPYRIVGGARFYERAEVRDAVAYLRLVAHIGDSLAFERIVNTPRRGVGPKALETIRFHARRHGVPLAEAARELAAAGGLAGAARHGVGELSRLLARWRTEAAELPPSALAQAVLEESGYVAMLETDRAPEAPGRRENLQELVRAVDDFPTLRDFLDHVSLVMENERAVDTPRVTLMTLHAAKGLEFDHVFLPGWEEGVFPSSRALEEGGEASLEEERRLAYVGITRARRRAVITHAANRRVYGQWTSSIPSRFVDELPAEHVARETTLTGGASLWRAAAGAADDPFRHLERSTGRGPGWERARARGGLGGPGGPVDAVALPRRQAEGQASPASIMAPARAELGPGTRVFHQKFGPGTVAEQEGPRLCVDFDHAGRKTVLDHYVKPA